jgi:hypothetical protein
MRRAASDEVLLQREDSFHDIETYNNEPGRSNERRSQKNSSPPFKKRPISKRYLICDNDFTIF